MKRGGNEAARDYRLRTPAPKGLVQSGRRWERNMVIRLSPELEHIVEEKVKSGQFRSPEDVIAEALRRLPKKQEAVDEAEKKAKQREAVEKMLEIAKTPIRLDGISIKDLINEGRL
ncbi:MAG: ribbon-helix-helix domain-containing protein [Candidatus Acidiferrales bacterium]